MSLKAKVGIDIGGTFTDVALEIDTLRHTTKVLTTQEGPEIGVLDGLAKVMEAAGVVISQVSLIIHGTTLATNALIQRKGALTGLLTTEGFRDVLQIRGEDRYEQYDLSIELPKPLIARRHRLTVPERIDARGHVRIPLDIKAVERAAEDFRRLGVEAVAVGFLHSYANSTHEEEAGEILARYLSDVSISLSSKVAPEMREYDRFSTAAANAYVQPLMSSYLDRLESRLHDLGSNCPLLLMLSSGGLTTVETAKRFPVRLVESGPAGGAAFAADIAKTHGLGNILSFDMGGTTAKLCLIDDGTPHRSRDFEVDRVWRFRKGSGLPLRIPVIEMVEIGAGGGSHAAVDALNRVTVGPESAGSFPGPACYGLGGTAPTVTDANLIVGRLDADNFAGGSMTLDTQASFKALDTNIATNLSMTARLSALSVTEVVEENMASAAKVHAVERGADISGRVMIAFGGGAPLHALRMADKLSINRVIIPAGAGVGSAIGFLRAPVSYEVVRSLHQLIDILDLNAVGILLKRSEEEAACVVRSAAELMDLEVERKVSMRYVGQGHEIEVAVSDASISDRSVFTSSLTQAFKEAYLAFYGRLVPEGPLECLTWSVNVIANVGQSAAAFKDEHEIFPSQTFSSGTRRVTDPETGEEVDCPVYDRATLSKGAHITGPAIIFEQETSTFISPNFSALVGKFGALDCSRKEPKQ